MADFAIVDIGDLDASSWLLVSFTVPVRLAAARKYCEIVWAGDGGSDGGWRRSTLPVPCRGACGGLLRIGGQRSPIPREGWSGRSCMEVWEVSCKGVVEWYLQREGKIRNGINQALGGPHGPGTCAAS